MRMSKSFDPLKMKREQFNPFLVATSLSRINRYCGHGHFAYSVAQHSVLLSYVVPPRLARAALTHDVQEIWINDVVTPIKSQMAEYPAIEERYQRVISKVLDIPYSEFLEVEPWDKRICIDEMLVLFDDANVNPALALGIPIEPHTAEQARDHWLNRFHALMIPEVTNVG